MGMLGMLAAGGAGIDVSEWLAKMPCAPCTIESAGAIALAKQGADPDALAVIGLPQPSVTIAIGTPVCAAHGAQLLEAVGFQLPDALWLTGGLGRG